MSAPSSPSASAANSAFAAVCLGRAIAAAVGAVHCYSVYIGGRFQSYTMGNILSAQFYAAALKAHPDIPQEIATGQFRTLHTWLRDHIYQHGSKFVPNDLVKHATGKAMTVRPYLDYLPKKYGALYRLPASA
jgi:carboxypeptidase Taq